MAFDKLNPKSSFNPRSHLESFLFYLFNDADFAKEVDRIRSKIKRIVGEDAFGIVMLLSDSQSLIEQLAERGTSKTSRIAVFLRGGKSDPELNASSSEADVIRDIRALASRFKVSIATAELGIRYTNLAPDLAFKSSPYVSIEGDKVIVRLGANTRLSDIKQMFWQIEELQRQLPDRQERNKPQERPDLVFAIYKQRLAGKTFKVIYDLYERGELPGYDGAPGFNSEENLVKMYKRFKPDI